MFRASLCPSSGEKKAPLLHLMYVGLVLLDVVGSGCGALRCRMRAAYAHLQENKGPVTAFGLCWSGFVGCGW